LQKFCPDDLTASLTLGEVYMWKSSLDGSDEAAVEALKYYEEKLLPKAEQAEQQNAPRTSVLTSLFGWGKANQPSESPEEVLARQERYIETLTALAEIHASCAMLLMRTQQRLKGGYRLRKAWKYFEQAFEQIKTHPEWSKFVSDRLPGEIDDSQAWQDIIKNATPKTDMESADLRERNVVGRVLFGKGFFIYSISMLPKALQWLVEMVGFTSDHVQGLRDLVEASQISYSPRAIWARVAIGTIRFFFFDEQDQAFQLVEQLLEQLPESPILHSSLGRMYRTEGRLEESTASFQKSIELSEELPNLQITLAYELGSNYFLQLDWERALPLIERYLNESRSKNFKAFGGWKMGVCLWMLKGEEALEQIKPLYSKVINEWKRKQMSYDVFAARLCQQFLDKSKFSEIDIEITSVANLVEGYLFEEAKTHLQKLEELVAELPEAQRAEDQGMSIYLKGHLLHTSKHHDEAMKCFSELFHMADKIQREKWILPYAEVESIEIFIERKDFDKAQLGLDSVRSKSGFDFEKHLGMRIKKLQAKVNRLKEATQNSVYEQSKVI